MEEAEEDDMVCGDLGNGLGRRPGGVYEGEKLQNYSLRSKKVSVKAYNTLSSIKGVEENDATSLPCSKRNSFHDGSSKKPLSSLTRQSSCESSSEMSNEELKQQLREALEAVFSKATSHTKAMLEKTEEEKRTLEKEINILQWEIEFDQDRFKNIEDTWTEKYDRIYCENTALKEALKLRTEEVKTLKSENAILNQQLLEFLAMLDVNKQKIVQENMSMNKRDITDITGLELAVLGACTCNSSVGQPCPCAKMAAVTRKQILHLKQEIELLMKSKDEAYIMADAFRIAFEQQLMHRKDQALRLAEVIKIKKETKFINWRRLKEDGSVKLQGNKNSLGQKLSGLLSSDADSRKVEELDNPHEILKMLIDLVNDKEEALAHQRKVSYMLARAMELKEAAQQTEGQPPTGHGGKAVQPCGPAALGPACCCDLASPSSLSSASSGNGFQNLVRQLRKSHSWPREAAPHEESDPCGKACETVVISI
ncbi:coiled-coil domain-containing protein 125 isoform X2 [Meleagris gallopavo]|uniref:coiled-coil domain-containing protein 125 isoform X2 n=1 Tax=Meleagris gallopavo TaxID=9103 RepID=UPI000549BFF1|nr:coiled-coil domain-containing protein 125 isoform X2 [Meleagris gallopavo]